MKSARQRRFILDEQDRWSEDRLKTIQLRKLKRVLKYAYENLPFYQRRFDAAGVHPDAVKSFEDFTRLPAFTKKEVLREMNAQRSFTIGMEARIAKEPAVLCMTSGTLGTSFLYLPDKWRSIRGDSLIRFYWWGGLRPGMKMLLAAPAWHGFAVQEARAVERLGVTCVVPWGTFLPQYAGNFIDTIIDVKPDFISMFLPMLYALLAECRRRGTKPAKVFSSVKYLLLVGAPMTPRSREALKAELGVLDISEGLGNPEALTAMECSFHRGHHVFMDCCYVEVVDRQTGHPLPPGRRGSVVVTSLIPHGSVYIRYDTEDVGEILPQPCECGSRWPLLEVYDRWVNAVQVGGKEIFPYDVRVCLDDVSEFIGLPFGLIRGKTATDYLRILLQKTSTGNLSAMGNQLRTLLKEKLLIDAREEWTEQLPIRWKGVTVIDEKDWRTDHV